MTTTTNRNTGLGASDAAAAIGVSPYKSRFSLWAEKTGQVEPPDLSEKEAVQWGNYLQPRIAEVYADKTGRIVRQNRADVARHHPDHPWPGVDRDCAAPVARRRAVSGHAGFQSGYRDGSGHDCRVFRNGQPGICRSRVRKRGG